MRSDHLTLKRGPHVRSAQHAPSAQPCRQTDQPGDMTRQDRQHTGRATKLVPPKPSHRAGSFGDQYGDCQREHRQHNLDASASWTLPLKLSRMISAANEKKKPTPPTSPSPTAGSVTCDLTSLK